MLPVVTLVSESDSELVRLLVISRGYLKPLQVVAAGRSVVASYPYLPHDMP
jgi:hypothetical protein